jgi:hypothetical protein
MEAMTMAHNNIIIKQFDSADKEEFNRPDHPDFKTAFELSRMEWSGVRLNSITHDHEIWVLGECKGKLSEEQYLMNPESWTKLYAEVFALKSVEIIDNGKKGN